MGYELKSALKEAERCLNCDMQTVFTESACIECDSCVDICPTECITFTANAATQAQRQAGGGWIGETTGTGT